MKARTAAAVVVASMLAAGWAGWRLSAYHSAPGSTVPPDAGAFETFGTMGKERQVLQRGREVELFRRDGAGVLTHMWFGGGFKTLGRTRLRLYVDGERVPSIDMALYLGHGIGFDDPGAPWGTARIGITGHQGGLYNTYRVPFGNGIRITAQLADEETEQRPPLWWIVRGSEGLPIDIAGVRLPANARLKLYTRENHTAQPLEEFALVDTPGTGLLYQVTMAGRSSNLSYMEACMRAYVGGAKEPLWLSSGLEDYFLGTYYFQTGRYHTPLAGLTHFDPKDHSFSAYRFHEDDPVFFRNGLRLTARVGESLNGRVWFEPKPTTYWTYAWTYEW